MGEEEAELDGDTHMIPPPVEWGKGGQKGGRDRPGRDQAGKQGWGRAGPTAGPTDSASNQKGADIRQRQRHGVKVAKGNGLHLYRPWHSRDPDAAVALQEIELLHWRDTPQMAAYDAWRWGTEPASRIIEVQVDRAIGTAFHHMIQSGDGYPERRLVAEATGCLTSRGTILREAIRIIAIPGVILDAMSEHKGDPSRM